MQVDFPQETAEIQEPTQEAAPTAQNPQNPLVLEQEFQNVELEISRVIEALHEGIYE